MSKVILRSSEITIYEHSCNAMPTSFYFSFNEMSQTSNLLEYDFSRSSSAFSNLALSYEYFWFIYLFRGQINSTKIQSLSIYVLLSLTGTGPQNKPRLLIAVLVQKHVMHGISQRMINCYVHGHSAHAIAHLAAKPPNKL